MKCPHRIEPHQIQGLDFIHIYPVVQVNHLASFLNFAFALIIYVKDYVDLSTCMIIDS